MSLTVYLSGPITKKTEKEAREWRDNVATTLVERGFKVLNPLRGQSFSHEPISSNESPDPYLSDKALKKRDYQDVMLSDIVLANFEGASSVSLGSVAEIAIADIMNKLVVVALPDNDPYHNHPFIRDAGVRFPTLEEAVRYVLSCGVGE